MGVRDVASDSVRTRTMFLSSRGQALFEHFRIPYELADRAPSGQLERVSPSIQGPSLWWSSSHQGAAVAARVLGADRATEVHVFARVMSDAALGPLLGELGEGWRRARVISDPSGAPLGSIWVAEDGSLFLPFDPDEVLLNFLSERYTEIVATPAARHATRALAAAYYRARPLIARPLQIWLRRRYARVQARSAFPRWPIEPCLHDFLDLMIAILASLAGEPVPTIAPWPEDHQWALVLTHDVERARGWEALEPVLDLERARGVRSAWNLVPRRDYDVSIERVRALVADGFEVGVHGLHHDGRDISSRANWGERIPHIRDCATRWGAVGFRSPALHRRWEWMPELGLDYDSSYPDTDPFEPQTGGCCSWLPFFNEETVELPITLAQDHTLFVILSTDERAWIDKASVLRQRHGMALIDTHPDYLLDTRFLTAYGRFLDRFASDPTAWRALPREVSSWWRKRRASSLERDGDTWRVVGPAADAARVQLLEGTW